MKRNATRCHFIPTRQVFPGKIAEQLMRNQRVEPQAFSEVTVFFSDIVGAPSVCCAHNAAHTRCCTRDAAALRCAVRCAYCVRCAVVSAGLSTHVCSPCREELS